MENKSIVKHNFFKILITMVAIVGIGTSIFFYAQYRKAQNIINNPIIQGQLEAKDLVQRISKLMLLPGDEQPTVATVSDSKKLKDQPFFKNAQNGDKVLIYTKAKMAILYDPKANKILAVMPVNLGQTETPIRIELYNGTPIVGLTNTVEQALRAKLNNIVISGKENARGNYKKTIVIDLIGSQQKSASDLAVLLGGETGSLPEGEKLPSNADLLIILGQ